MRRGVLGILTVGTAAVLAWLLLIRPSPPPPEHAAALVEESAANPLTEPERASAARLAAAPSEHPLPQIDPEASSVPKALEPSDPAATPAPPARSQPLAADGIPEPKPEAKDTKAPEGEASVSPAFTPETAEDAAEEETEIAALPRPEAQDVEDEAQATDAPPPGAPVFDLVRVSPDGQVVIAGRAEPGATVEVVLEGKVAGEAEADRSGAFVTILQTEPSAEPRQMLLRVPDRRLARIDQSDAAAQDAEGGPAGPRPSAAQAPGYLSSAPVIILPVGDPAAPPVLVRADESEVEIVQPAPLLPGEMMALDRITYEAGGDVIAAGRGEEATAIRTYANGVLVAETPVAGNGDWQATIPRNVAAETAILRFDSISPGGNVTSRVETAFAYQTNGADLAVRQREVTIERGNNLWRLAEQHYGEGIRYSVIFSANSDLIRDPDLIYPGQVFTVPELVDSE